MQTTAEPIDARPRPDEQMQLLFADGWPAFITADQEAKLHIGRVREQFGDLELVLLDGDDVIIGACWGVPIAWSGEPSTLPGGYTDAMRVALAQHDAGVQPDTLVVMAAQVRPDRRGAGVAGELLRAMYALAEARGWPRVVAPVRPTLKTRYPLIDIDTFAGWTRDDGAPLDPWIRTHHRLGARIVATAPASQTMTGTVAEWESWTDLALPSSGQYVIPDGLGVLTIDREADLGTYTEPNVWMQHR